MGGGGAGPENRGTCCLFVLSPPSMPVQLGQCSGSGVDQLGGLRTSEASASGVLSDHGRDPAPRDPCSRHSVWDRRVLWVYRFSVRSSQSWPLGPLGLRSPGPALGAGGVHGWRLAEQMAREKGEEVGKRL